MDSGSQLRFGRNDIFNCRVNKKRDMAFDGRDYMVIVMLVTIQPGSEEVGI